MKILNRMAITLVVFLLAFSGMAFAQSEWGKGQVNVNTASRDELVWFLGQSNIDNPGEVADNILAYRDANGPFDRMDELNNVSGVDQTTFDWIQERVKVSGPTDYDPEVVLKAPGNREPYLPPKD